MAVTQTRNHGRTMRVAAAVLLCALTGCREDQTDKPPRQFFPDMDDQPKYKPQARSTFFHDYTEPEHPAHHVRDDPRMGHSYGRTMRDPVKNTVAFGASWHTSSYMDTDFAQRADMLAGDLAIYSGTTGYIMGTNGQPELDEQGEPKYQYVDRIPIPVDEELLALGEEQYNIYCIVCHGGLGDGKGIVGKKWSYDLPTWHQEQYYHGGAKGTDGFIFHTIRHGVPNVGGTYQYKMRPYASKLSVEESWAVVAYIRALQHAANGELNDVPAAERERLIRQRGPVMTPAPRPPAAPQPEPPAAPAQQTPAGEEGEL